MLSATLIISALWVKILEIIIKHQPGIKIFSSMYTLLFKKKYSELLLFLPYSRMYNSALVVCMQVVVLLVILCRALRPENGQTPWASGK